MLTLETLPDFQAALREADLDGWLLFDFRGTNPVASALLGLEGMVSRRVFAFVPREGVPVAITHAIEQLAWARWPSTWGRERYSSWRALESALRTLVGGRRVAMEYSPGDAVPYVDRIPAGVLELVRAAGAEVVSSGELVTRFFALWTPAERQSHERAAEVVRAVALAAFDVARTRVHAGDVVYEHELQQWILDAFAREGFDAPDHRPNVSAGSNASNPHYEPSADHPRALAAGELLLIDLWARYPGGIYADQTWMAALGAPSARAVDVWTAVRDARDAAVTVLADRVRDGVPVRGAEADAAARRVIGDRGYAEYFTHRTGHSIDARDLHGAGPHLDDFETREERLLIAGTGFSIEPGIYLPGELGVRSEVNATVAEDRLVVTPREYQRELISL